MAMQLLPPRPGYCQICAVEHDEHLPHDATSLYYQFRFNAEHGHSATWNDAMEHCSPATKVIYLEHLEKLGIDPASTNVRGNLKSQAEVEERLNKGK
jgi:hypothetical protein